MDGVTPESSARSGGVWSSGLSPGRALGLEVVRFAFAVFLAATLVFLFFQVWAGPVAFLMAPHDPKYAGIAAVDREIFALDQPVWTRYGVWLANVVTGNLGISFAYHEPVTQVVLEKLPVTLELLCGTILWTLLLGVLLGWGSSSPRHRLLAGTVNESATVLYSIPVFVAVLGLVYWMSTSFQISLAGPFDYGSPAGPQSAITGFPILDRLLAGDLGAAWLEARSVTLLALPAGIAFAMPVAHRVRAALQARRAQLGPNPGRPIRSRPWAAVRALLAPLAGALGVLIPFLVSATVLTELLGGRRGVGLLLLQAVFNLDGPLLQGVAILLALVALAIGLPLALVGAGFAGSGASLRPLAEAGGWGKRASFGAARSVRTVFRRSLGATLVLAVGLVLTIALFGLALLGPLLAAYGPSQRVVPIGNPCTTGVDCPLSPPSAAHPLGVDFFGFDILSRVLWGGGYLLSALAVALAVAAGLGFALGLLPSALGRGADAVLRTGLGAVAAVPVFILVLLAALLAGTLAVMVPVAIGLLFVPVVFRDVRDLAARTVDPTALHGRDSLRLGWMVNRTELGVASSVPGFLARLPRRAAEMVLLLESVTVLGLSAPRGLDWGSEMADALNSNVVVTGNPGALFVPALLVTLLVLGLVLLSEGLWGMLVAEAARPPSGTPVAPSTADANP